MDHIHYTHGWGLFCKIYIHEKKQMNEAQRNSRQKQSFPIERYLIVTFLYL